MMTKSKSVQHIEDVGGDAGKIVGPTNFWKIRSQDGACETVKKGPGLNWQRQP